MEGTSVFKAITGGDPIEAERKGIDPFMFTPFCKLLFSANSAPRSKDGSEGFFDRWLVVPFHGRFRGTKKEISRRELDARLTTPAELSGLLNHAIESWRRIQKTGRLSEPESVKSAWREFHAMTDPMSVWLNQFTVDDPDAVVAKEVLRSAYGAACEQAGRPSPTANAFGRAFRKLRDNVQTAQRHVNGRKQWCFVEIGFRNDDFESPREQEYPSPLIRTEKGKEEIGNSTKRIEREREIPVLPVLPVLPVTSNGTLLGRSAPTPPTREGGEVTEF